MKEAISKYRSDSKIERMINDEAFTYSQPWFYNHPFALRCELGMGETNRAYMKNAKERVLAIWDILFPCVPDAIFFHYYVTDYSSWEGDFSVKTEVAHFKKDLEFLSEHIMGTYESNIMFNVPRDENEVEFCLQKNRIICYPGKDYPYKKRVLKQLGWFDRRIHFVSFENECILSVYDDRGCDIVFATQEKLREFYDKLEPYLLEYDLEEMRKRVAGGD